MPLVYPTYDELVDIARAAIRNNNPDVDPTIETSWARTFVDSCAALAHSNNLQIRDLETQLFPQTATGEFLDRWLEYEGLVRTPARGGRGPITITGINGTVIPVSTIYTGSNGLLYTTQTVATIIDTTLSVSSITRVGTIATASFGSNHGLASGNNVTHSGATQPEYNGAFEITVISDTAYTFTVAGSPTTPATGTISADASYTSVAVECTNTGPETNLDSGAVLAIQTSIPGADDQATVGSAGVTGGANVEEDESARSRLLLSRSSRSGVFTADQIRLAALSVSGNTRVFVIEPELPIVVGRPVAGQVFIYFLRDNDTNPIPSSTLIAETKEAIITLGAKPGNTIDDDVVVQAPTPVVTDYVFTSIIPDTPTMRTAVEDQIKAFYQDSVQFEQDITEASYLGTIVNTQDLQTGDVLTSFSLSTPTGDISIGIGEIGFAGNVSFP